MFVAAAVAVVAVQVPETVTCHLLVVPGQGTDPVRVPHDGFVTAVRVRETEAVREGDVLFAIRVDTVGDRAGELRSVTVQLEGARESLANAARRYERQRLADADEEQRLVLHGDALARRAEGMTGVQAIKRRENTTALEMVREQIGSLTREEGFRQKARAFALEEIERGTRLNRSNMISIHEYSSLKLEAEKSGFELERVVRELSTARFKSLQLKAEQEGQEAEWNLKMEQLEADRKENASALAKLRHQAGVAESEYEEQRRALHEQMAKSSARIAALTGQLGQSTADQVLVKAPYAGIVLRLRVRSSGSFVRSGDVLCELAGTKGKVVAELTVPENGVGRVRPRPGGEAPLRRLPLRARSGARYGRVRVGEPGKRRQGRRRGGRHQGRGPGGRHQDRRPGLPGSSTWTRRRSW